jgi:hypothetical protein
MQPKNRPRRINSKTRRRQPIKSKTRRHFTQGADYNAKDTFADKTVHFVDQLIGAGCTIGKRRKGNERVGNACRVEREEFISQRVRRDG